MLYSLLRFTGRLSQGNRQGSSYGLPGQSLSVQLPWPSKSTNQPQDDSCVTTYLQSAVSTIEYECATPIWFLHPPFGILW